MTRLCIVLDVSIFHYFFSSFIKEFRYPTTRHQQKCRTAVRSAYSIHDSSNAVLRSMMMDVFEGRLSFRSVDVKMMAGPSCR